MTKLGKIALAAALLLTPGNLDLAQSLDQASAKKRAIADLKEVAYAGNVNAQVQLGVIYLTGDGVAKDDAEAVKWLRMAADQGDAESEHNLAVLYTQGQGVPRNLKEAANWMRKAADQNLAAG